MALKDLPGSVALDILNLIAQAPLYVEAYARKQAGPRPSARSYGNPYGPVSQRVKIILATLVVKGKPIPSFISWYQSYIAPNVKASGTATIGSKFISISDWNNSFFKIRTSIVGVVNTGDPVLTALDSVWTQFQNVDGRWTGFK
jgi:hypothetical protein